MKKNEKHIGEALNIKQKKVEDDKREKKNIWKVFLYRKGKMSSF